MLHRLACKNGLIVSLPGATLVQSIHRGLDIEKVRERLVTGLHGLPERINTSAKLLAQSTHVEVANVELEIRTSFARHGFRLRLVSSVVASYLQ